MAANLALTSATVGATGLTLTTIWEGSATHLHVTANHSSAVPTVAVAARGQSGACTYSSGDGGDPVWTIPFAVFANDTATVTFPASTVTDSGTGTLINVLITGAATTNNSVAKRLPNPVNKTNAPALAGGLTD